MKPIPIDEYVAQFGALSSSGPKPRVSHIWSSERHSHASVSTPDQVVLVVLEGGWWHAEVFNKAFAGGSSSLVHRKVCATREEAADWASKWLREILF